jgi:hypothetical protein
MFTVIYLCAVAKLSFADAQALKTVYSASFMAHLSSGLPKYATGTPDGYNVCDPPTCRHTHLRGIHGDYIDAIKRVEVMQLEYNHWQSISQLLITRNLVPKIAT